MEYIEVGKVIIEAKEHLNDKERLKLTVKGSRSMQGSRIHLRSLFSNLLSNAIKYRQGDTVTVVCSIQDEGEMGCRVEVKDDGQNFDPAEAEIIFLPFRRLKDRKCSGHGLGLTTCHKIAKRHGGEIFAEGKEGKGATFTVILR